MHIEIQTQPVYKIPNKYHSYRRNAFSVENPEEVKIDRRRIVLMGELDNYKKPTTRERFMGKKIAKCTPRHSTRFHLSSSELQHCSELWKIYTRSELHYIRSASITFDFEEDFSKRRKVYKMLLFLLRQLKNVQSLLFGVDCLRMDKITRKADATKCLEKLFFRLNFMNKFREVNFTFLNMGEGSFQYTVSRVFNLLMPRVRKEGGLERMATRCLLIEFSFKQLRIDLRSLKTKKNMEQLNTYIRECNNVYKRDHIYVAGLTFRLLSFGDESLKSLSVIDLQGNQEVFKNLYSLSLPIVSKQCCCTYSDPHLPKAFIDESTRYSGQHFFLGEDTGLKNMLLSEESPKEFWQTNIQKLGSGESCLYECRGRQKLNTEFIDKTILQTSQFQNLTQLCVEYFASKCYFTTSGYFKNLSVIAKNCHNLVSLIYSNSIEEKNNLHDFISAYDVLQPHFKSAVQDLTHAQWKIKKILLSFVNVIESIYPEDMKLLKKFVKTLKHVDIISFVLPPYIETTWSEKFLKKLCNAIMRLPMIKRWEVYQHCVINHKITSLESYGIGRKKYTDHEDCFCSSSKSITVEECVIEDHIIELHALSERMGKFHMDHCNNYFAESYAPNYNFKFLLTSNLSDQNQIIVTFPKHLTKPYQKYKVPFIFSYIESFFNKPDKKRTIVRSIVDSLHIQDSYILFLVDVTDRYKLRKCCNVYSDIFM